VSIHGVRLRYITFYLKYLNQSIDIKYFQLELPHLQRAYQWAKEARDNRLVLELWENSKDHLMDFGYWQIFISWGMEILQILDQAKRSKDEAWLQSDLGWIAMEQSEFDSASHMFQRSKGLFADIEDPRGVCVLERYQGVLAYRRDKFKEASTHYRASLEIATIEKFSGMIAEINNLQGSLARKLGNDADARQLYKEAIQGFKRLDDKWRLTAVIRNLARLEFQSGNYDAAEDAFTQAIELCERINRKDILYGCQLGLAEVEIILGNVEKAKSLLASARLGFSNLGMRGGLERIDRVIDGIYRSNSFPVRHE